MQDRLAKKDRLASLVTLAAGAAHELNTPLATIAVVAKELERYASLPATDPEISKHANQAIADDSRLIRTEVERCTRILSRLMADGAEPAGETPQPIGVSDLLAGLRAEFPQNDQVRIESPNGDVMAVVVLPIHAVQQALVALVKNAVQSSSAAAAVSISAFVFVEASRPAESHIRFTVRDLGIGMSAETLRHVGEPFFTTKEPGQGMGLGVFLVRTLADRLGGHLSFDSSPGNGTVATLELPIKTSRKPIEGSEYSSGMRIAHE
jgi:two-component system sensor histidine kinase RegB